MNTTCSLCGGPYQFGGNNPDPFPDGRACHVCNTHFVVPARILRVSDPEILKLLTKFARLGRHLVMETAKSRHVQVAGDEP